MAKRNLNTIKINAVRNAITEAAISSGIMIRITCKVTGNSFSTEKAEHAVACVSMLNKELASEIDELKNKMDNVSIHISPAYVLACQIVQIRTKKKKYAGIEIEIFKKVSV